MGCSIRLRECLFTKRAELHCSAAKHADNFRRWRKYLLESDCQWNASNLNARIHFSAPSTEIYLNANIASFNFGGGEYGSGSLWASTDGQNWTDLMDAPTPAYTGNETGYLYSYAQDLPISLLGADQIYIQAQLNTSGWNIMAQFMREGDFNNQPFAIDANVVPESSTMSLFCTGFTILALYYRNRWRNSPVVF